MALGIEVLVYEASSGVQLRRLCGHVESVASVAFAAHASGSCFLLSGGWDNRLILWDVVSGGAVVCVHAAHRASISAVAVNAHLAVKETYYMRKRDRQLCIDSYSRDLF